MSTARTLSLADVRRLAISCQRLNDRSLKPDAAGIMQVLSDIRCLQIDPIRAVEHTQLLVLWSRLGKFDPALLDQLLFEDRQLFEYWAHCASIVLTEDYPIHAARMRHHRESERYAYAQDWIAANREMHQYVLARLRAEGPLSSDQFEDRIVVPWKTSGWNNGRNVSLMLAILWEQGELMVANRKGRRRFWDLSEAYMPEWTEAEELSASEITASAALYSLRALGVATPGQIKIHFTRNFYPGLIDVLARLAQEGAVEQVEVVDNGVALPGPWYIHADRLPLLESIQRDDWQPSTTLLSPFDNLICDRARTELLFDFNYRIEIYVPAAKRQYGYYVLPILHGDRLIGRIDSKMDRKTRRYAVPKIYLEPNIKPYKKTGKAVIRAIESLASFIGADAVDYGDVPAKWVQ